MTLANMKVGESGIILKIDDTGDSITRLAELGMVAGEHITLLKKAPLGDPIAVRLMNYELCLRNSDARAVHIKLE